jgi:hypothetical protein
MDDAAVEAVVLESDGSFSLVETSRGAASNLAGMSPTA